VAPAVYVQEGFYVDETYLQEQQKEAERHLKEATGIFRGWLCRKADIIGVDAEKYNLTPEEVAGLVNFNSTTQIQTLLFGGFEAAQAVMKKPPKGQAALSVASDPVKPKVDVVRCSTFKLCCTVSLPLDSLTKYVMRFCTGFVIYFYDQFSSPVNCVRHVASGGALKRLTWVQFRCSR
jgi:hypothetical protein